MLQIHQGTLIDDRYQVISRVGSGGMADVYCAEDLQLGRRVAVKVLHERFAEDEEFVERFRREASSAASLSHANIVSVYDRGEWGGTYYIAMEFLEGRSLDVIVREEAPLTPERSIDLTEQVLRAARFAHKRGVVHRDLKPHNVIIDGEGRVKVTDFGIARAGASEITQTGSIMGTARYLSPEQAQGAPVGPRGDLYAIGVMLYELLTGTVPFEGDSVVAIALRHLSEPPRPPSAIIPSISPSLDAIVLHALAKEPGQRFADADAFLAALEAERERLRAEDGSRTASFLPAVPIAAATAVQAYSTQTLLPAAHQGEVGYWDPNTTSITHPPPPPSRGSAWPWAVFGVLLAIAAIVALLFLLIKSHTDVPSVVGDNSVTASTLLANDGFVPATNYRSSVEPVGTVLAQSPLPGTVLGSGDTVLITLSSGPASRGVPNVVGDTTSAAEAALKKAGFKYKSMQASSTTVKKGMIISTNPVAGSSLAPNSTVALTISTGAPLVRLVNVVGDTYTQAQTILIADGFNVVPTYVPQSSTPGIVLSELPTTRKAPEGSTVKLTVSSAPKTVTVPNVVGETEAEAVGQLVSLGLKASPSTQTTSNPADQDIVLSQNPLGNKVVAPGSVVQIVVGSYSSSSTGGSGPSGST
jgi:serine/threonine-protein kinase